LQDPEVQNFDCTTPDFYPKPTPNSLFNTPKKPNEYEAIISQIEHKLSPSNRVKIRKLDKGAIQENSINLALNSELHKVRKEDKSKEINKRTQRLQKELKQRSFSVQEIREARRAKGEPIRARIAYKTEEKLILAIPTKNPK
jgi:PBP1b-binding outer membrane lipoprotein LpoB